MEHEFTDDSEPGATAENNHDGWLRASRFREELAAVNRTGPASAEPVVDGFELAVLACRIRTDDSGEPNRTATHSAACRDGALTPAGSISP